MKQEEIQNCVIIGSGPAGYTCAIYLARADLKPLLITGLALGGQLTTTTDVENYPGFISILGPELMNNMQKQAEHAGCEFVYNIVTKIEKQNGLFTLTLDSGKQIISKTVVISTGSSAKWLNFENEEHFKGYGISACATCDGPFYKNKTVAVIGGGNTAVEEALYLSSITKTVYLIHRRDELRAEKILQNRLLKTSNIKPIWNSSVIKANGNEKPKKLTSITYKNVITGKENNLELDGVFVAIGHKPNTDFIKNLITLDESGYILTEPDSTKTNVSGIFAAGDVKDKKYKQAITAAGSGCMASLEVAEYLNTIKN